MRAQDVSAYEEGKRESLHHKQRMVFRDSSEFNRRTYVPADFCVCASTANDTRRSACEGLNGGRVWQSAVHGTVQH